MKLTVKHSAYLCYGSANHCHVFVKERQVWEKIYETTDFVGLQRGEVTIELTHADYKRMFEVK